MPEWMKTAGIGVNYDVDSMEMQLCSHTVLRPTLVSICPPFGSFTCICHLKKTLLLWRCTLSTTFLQNGPCFFAVPSPVKSWEAWAQGTGDRVHSQEFPISTCIRHLPHIANLVMWQTHTQIHTHTHTHTQKDTQACMHAHTHSGTDTYRHTVWFPLNSSTLTAHILVVRSPFDLTVSLCSPSGPNPPPLTGSVTNRLA